MPQVCKTCSHPDRRLIERLILEGVPRTRIGKRFGIHALSVWKHDRRGHMLPDLVRAHKRKELAHAGTCLEITRDILSRALEGMDEARGAKEIGQLVTAATNANRLLGQVTGEVKQDVFMVFLQAHGIKSEAELKEIVTAHRQASSALTVEDCERDGVALLRWVIKQNPERLPRIMLGIQGAKLLDAGDKEKPVGSDLRGSSTNGAEAT